jgi:hypothetical protein
LKNAIWRRRRLEIEFEYDWPSNIKLNEETWEGGGRKPPPSLPHFEVQKWGRRLLEFKFK